MSFCYGRCGVGDFEGLLKVAKKANATLFSHLRGFHAARPSTGTHDACAGCRWACQHTDRSLACKCGRQGGRERKEDGLAFAATKEP